MTLFITRSFLVFLLFFLNFYQEGIAKRLQDDPYYEYEVRFTNPVCKKYSYQKAEKSFAGETLVAKPKNVFCKKSDKEASASRPESPASKLVSWIDSPETQEIFLAFLYYSSPRATEALKRALDRGVKVTFVLDKGSLRKKCGKGGCVQRGLRKVQELWKSKNAGTHFDLLIRGQENDVGYAHNKLIIFNPNSRKDVRLVYGSGNLSSGLTVQHDNWHFVKASAKSYFIKSHLCLKEGMIHHHQTQAQYAQFIQDCQARIGAAEESDIQTYFVPGQGEKALADIGRSAHKAQGIDIAAHRFSSRALIRQRKNQPLGILGKALKSKKSVRLLVDDDTFWSWKLFDLRSGRKKKHKEPECGSCNQLRGEYSKIRRLAKKGLKVRFFQTNHWARLIHHNKFIIFYNSEKKTQRSATRVFAGAGNFTSAAFEKNFENFYMISIPEVVMSFQKQYRRLWKMASHSSELPKGNPSPL